MTTNAEAHATLAAAEALLPEGSPTRKFLKQACVDVWAFGLPEKCWTCEEGCPDCDDFAYAPYLRLALETAQNPPVDLLLLLLDQVAAEIVRITPPINSNLRPDGSEDPIMSAYIEGLHDAWATVLNFKK